MKEAEMSEFEFLRENLKWPATRWVPGAVASTRGWILGVLCLTFLVLPIATYADTQPTSREIPFEFEVTHLPLGSTQTITVQVWDAATGGNLIFSEVHPNVKVGFFGEINFVLGALTTGGIPVADFP